MRVVPIGKIGACVLEGAMYPETPPPERDQSGPEMLRRILQGDEPQASQTVSP